MLAELRNMHAFCDLKRRAECGRHIGNAGIQFIPAKPDLSRQPIDYRCSHGVA